MNATTTVIELSQTTDFSSFEFSNVVSFCGKGLHYDWRAVVAAAEAADLDAELADLGTASTHSSSFVD